MPILHLFSMFATRSPGVSNELQSAKRCARWKVAELKTITQVQTKDWLQNGLKARRDCLSRLAFEAQMSKRFIGSRLQELKT